MNCVFGDEGIRTESTVLPLAIHAQIYLDLHKDSVSAAFAEEVRLENPACPDALRTLRTHFTSETSPGPMKASHLPKMFVSNAPPSAKTWWIPLGACLMPQPNNPASSPQLEMGIHDLFTWRVNRLKSRTKPNITRSQYS